MKKVDRIWDLIIAVCLALLIGAGIRSMLRSPKQPAAVTVNAPSLPDSTVPDKRSTPEQAETHRAVPSAEEPEPDETKAPDTNLNTADEAALRRVSGVGAVLAKRITDYRAKIGGFTRRAQLLEIEGVGEAIAARILEEFTIPGELPPETTAPPQTSGSTRQTAVSTRKTAAETAAEPVPPPARDLNTVTEAELLEIPGMTPERAAAILAMRENLHGFHSLRELILCKELTGVYISETLADYLYIEGDDFQPSREAAAG
ncbi:MAG: helix-hairpin-helix domain-containing protein [Oscillospiraceae bacterium]|nr:helix-hairpin-helix domain-containing protein [Oscillospiraceae bacterium]